MSTRGKASVPLLFILQMVPIAAMCNPSKSQFSVTTASSAIKSCCCPSTNSFYRIFLSRLFGCLNRPQPTHGQVLAGPFHHRHYLTVISLPPRLSLQVALVSILSRQPVVGQGRERMATSAKPRIRATRARTRRHLLVLPALRPRPKWCLVCAVPPYTRNSSTTTSAS